MKLRERTTCSSCERSAKRLAKLESQLAKALTRIGELEKQNAKLEEQLAKALKNSSTSSKPPSSDIVKPKKKLPKGSKKRKRGGQPGHERHLRPSFPPEAIDEFFTYTLDCCPDCGHKLLPSRKKSPRIIQQIEIEETPTRIEEHQGLAYWCPHCRKVHYATIPPALVKAGLVGPRLTALVAFMKGVCHASFATVRKFLRDVVGVTICRGQLAKLIGKVSESLAAAYAELFESLPEEPILNIDETGHKNSGDRFWTWCFRAQLYTFFKIDKSRGSKVLIEVLGKEFNGVLGCDYFGAYRKYMREFGALVQFCMAHLIRDVKFLITLSDLKQQAYGRRVRKALKELFAIIHRRDEMTAKAFQRALEAARQDVLKAATIRVPEGNHAQNLAKRFNQHGEAYFRFVTTPGVEPTNNLAEQAIRFVVIDRRITQGTRGETGQRWCERIWTVIATCVQQGRSVFDFLYKAVLAHFNSIQSPSLMPSGP
jgi:transposase